jgi:MoxR-like ATPase
MNRRPLTILSGSVKLHLMEPRMKPSLQINELIKNMERAIKGKPDAVQMAVVALLARGHLLIEDIPGVGKSTLALSLARSIDGSFKRIQFTSDLLPSDILGVPVYNPKVDRFEFHPGPIFTQILLADEINRTTPKTQSALLEAMNDRQVSVENHTHPLPKPFMVIATQNPSDHQGTYPLPESQLDRFMLRIRLGYPAPPDEKEILLQPDRSSLSLEPVLTSDEVVQLQEEVEKVMLDESLVDYLLAIIQATRRHRFLSAGVSTRGAIALQAAARALAFVEGRDYALPDDIKKLAPRVLGHRVLSKIPDNGDPLIQAESIISEIVEEITVPL